MIKDSKFKKEEQTTPPAMFSPGYFWSLNDPLDKVVLLEQLHDIYKNGCRSVCIHPMPPEFSPNTMGTNMTPEYLSEDYFEIIRFLVKECKKLSMNFYLYDEAAWPSGSAAGRVFAHDPQKFAKRIVRYKDIFLAANTVYRVPQDMDILCATRKGGGQISKTLLPGEKILSSENENIRLFYIDKNKYIIQGEEPIPDLFCSAAVQKFIELTHEQYKKYVGDEFGQTIKITFTDEPAVGATRLLKNVPWQLTWTEDMAWEFKKRKGYDIVSFIPSFFRETLDIDATKALLDFYDVWSELFAERYLRPLKKWCGKNSLYSSGHLGGEDEPGYNATAGFGHILRSLRELDIPGIDTIWQQIHPDNVETVIFPKYASSIARQSDGPDLVLSESFMVYGSGLTPAQMKWIIDQQLALGVNIFVFGHYLYSTRDHFMGFARPFFGQLNPFWKYLRKLHVYVQRMSYLLSRGYSDCSMAVYYPVRDIWAGGDCCEQAIKNHNKIAETLLKKQIDFDYIDDDVLVSKNVHSGSLGVGKMQYSTIIVPPVKWMTKDALKTLEKFSASGGKIVKDIEKLSEIVDSQIKIFPAQTAIRVNKRVCDDCVVYFLVNTDNREFVAAFKFSETAECLLYNAENDCYSRLKRKNNEYKLYFASQESKVIIFSKTPEKFKPGPVYQLPQYTKVLFLNSGWKLRVINEYIVGKHNFELKKIKNSHYRDIKLGDWRPLLGDDFSGDAEYCIEFDYDEHISEKILLDLGEVKYAASICLNGKRLGDALWMPFLFNVSGCLKKGKNVLKIIITNSLANSILANGVEQDWHKQLEIEWPLEQLAYDARQREYEKSSLPGGLFGPVQIIYQSNKKC